MLIVPVDPIPWQTLTIGLGGQNCRINLYQRRTGMFIDLLVSDGLIVGGTICHDRNRIVRSLYLGFVGDLAFFDQQGTNDPTWYDLGSRYLLYYLTPDEVAAATADQP